MVGIGDVARIIVNSLVLLIVEDVVDAHLLAAAAEGVHEALATLLETVDLVAEHRVVDVGVGHIVEVAADDDGHL